MLLPQPERVGVAGGESHEVEMDPGKPDRLRLLPLDQETIDDAALIEHFESS